MDREEVAGEEGVSTVSVKTVRDHLREVVPLVLGGSEGHLTTALDSAAATEHLQRYVLPSCAACCSCRSVCRLIPPLWIATFVEPSFSHACLAYAGSLKIAK